jgi:hypothetical protein
MENKRIYFVSKFVRIVMNLTLFSHGWTIENAEAFVEEMWQKMNLKYYERWWYS